MVWADEAARVGEGEIVLFRYWYEVAWHADFLPVDCYVAVRDELSCLLDAPCEFFLVYECL